MSCSTLVAQTVNMTVSAGALPEGFCPSSMQELFEAMVQRLIVTPNQAFTSFASGSVAPTSNVGPWLKDCETWFVWDDAIGAYVPMQFSSIASVPPGTVHAWAGTVANIPNGYLVADGSVYLQSDYPLLYAAIGQCYAPAGPCPVCEGSFYVPNLCDKFIVGACTDEDGCAKAMVSDGVTLTKCRDYTAHTHTGTVCTTEQDNVDGADPSSADNTCYPFVTAGESPRAIPPYCAMVWIIKV